MPSPPASRPAARIGSALRRFWWLLDQTRRALLNLLLLALLIGALALWWRSRPPPQLQPKTALVLDLSGRLVEQRSGIDLRQGLLLQARGGHEEVQTRLRDVLAALEAARSDPQITHALLLLDDLGGSGLPKLREVAAAITRFKAAGKPVYAWGSAYDQRQYYLAAVASEVWLHPLGSVDIEGFGGHRTYYKGLLDRVGIEAHVFRSGKFKNAFETLSATAPSPATQEADAALYGALWASWTGAVEAARRQPAGSVMQAIDSLPASLLAAGGDGARWALERHWVDALKTRDEMRAAMIDKGARADGDGPATFRQVHLGAYLARLQPAPHDDAVGVVIAQGAIGAGASGPGRIGGLSTAQLIREAREDRRIKALVLRVDSPGGSAFGSELVRRELELTRQAGKPVVVSMGDMAASGGYWISLAADEMIADETTVTGSIGVIAMLPTAERTLDKLGLNSGGVTTTWLRGAYDPRRGIEPRFAQLVQAGVDKTYRDFLQRAATQRKRTPQQIDAVAQGRVWTGRQALELGLVDRLGGFDDALKSAAQRARLADGSYRVQYVEAQPGRLQQMLQRFGLVGLPALPLGITLELTPEMSGLAALLGSGAAAAPPLLGAAVVQDLAWLGELAQQHRPYTASVHCLCRAPLAE